MRSAPGDDERVFRGRERPDAAASADAAGGRGGDAEDEAPPHLGAGLRITLKTATGKTVKSMKRGTYQVVVRDRSRIHNAHVVAPGFDRRTWPLTYTGTQTWKVKLARTGTLRFLCDPHALAGMKGSAKIVR